LFPLRSASEGIAPCRQALPDEVVVDGSDAVRPLRVAVALQRTVQVHPAPIQPLKINDNYYTNASKDHPVK